jgi:6-phosphogluconolactonase
MRDIEIFADRNALVRAEADRFVKLTRHAIESRDRWGDERCVSPHHPDSNYRMTRESLLDRIPIPTENVHRIRGEDDPHQATEAYEQTLRAFFGPEDPPWRSFDIVLLGMGPDGHTASMFPGTAASTESRRWVMPVHVERPRDMWCVTLTSVVLNAAGDVALLVAGADKAARLLHWMIDRDAAAQLRGAVT